MAEKHKNTKNRIVNERMGTASSIGLYEMLSQSENDVNSEYSSIVETIDEISKITDRE